MTSKGYSKEEVDQLPEFYVSVAVDEEPVVWMHPIVDPFVHQFVSISWWDRFKSIFKREFKVQVSVTGNTAAVFNTKLASKVSRNRFSEVWQKGWGDNEDGYLISGGDSRN
jgi:hypothetical protein